MIIFKTIEIQNFLSFGDSPVTFSLDRSSTTLITGSNGVGKSSISEAITFALFGKSFRGINKPELVNTTNQKGCLVKLTFDKNGKVYQISRGIKPNLFSISLNGIDLEEDAETKDFQKVLEGVLGFTYSDYIKVVLIGNANYKPLMQLTLPERREFVDSMLNVGVFTTMSAINKARVNDWKRERSELDIKRDAAKLVFDSATRAYAKVKEIGDERETELLTKIEYEKTKLSHIEVPDLIQFNPLYPDAKANHDNASTTKSELLSRVRKYMDDKTRKESTETSYREALAAFEGCVTPQLPICPEEDSTLKPRLADINESITAYRGELSSIKTTTGILSERIRFFNDHDSCEICAQSIQDSHKNEIISHCKSEASGLMRRYKELEANIDILNTERDEILSKIDNYNSTLRAFNLLKTTYDNKVRENEYAKREVDRIKSELDKFEAVDYTEACKEIAVQVQSLNESLEKFQSEMSNDQSLKETVESHNNTVRLKQLERNNVNSRITELDNELTAFRNRDDGSQFLKEIANAQSRLDDMSSEESALVSKKKVLDAATELLKDTGIKASVVKMYVPVLNQLINQYLENMGASYQIVLDENFNDSIKGRYKDEFSYKALSQGERQRIDLATLFACRKVSQICSGSDSNLLILDEVGDSSMDFDGIESLFQIVSDTCSDKNVFFVSHRVEMSDKCRSVIRLTKQNGFTKIV